MSATRLSLQSRAEAQDRVTPVAPYLSVIVPARDAAATLERCLSAIYDDLGDTPAEVIVVDDGSTDASAEQALAAGARLVRLNGRGPAAARNAGARASHCDILVFIDADCAPRPGCLAALVAPFTDSRVAAVRGGYASSQRSRIARFTQLELDEKQERMAGREQTALIDTVCAAYRRDVFFEAGCFDEWFPATSAEDADLSFRLAEQGKRLVFAAGALVGHHHAESLRVYIRRKFRFGFYRAELYRRYPGRFLKDGYTPGLMPIQITLSGAIGLLAGLAPWIRPARPLAALAVTLFLGASLPLLQRARRTDPTLAPWVPLLLFGRSLAQGAGLASGTLWVALTRRATGFRGGSEHSERPRARAVDPCR